MDSMIVVVNQIIKCIDPLCGFVHGLVLADKRFDSAIESTIFNEIDTHTIIRITPPAPSAKHYNAIHMYLCTQDFICMICLQLQGRSWSNIEVVCFVADAGILIREHTLKCYLCDICRHYYIALSCESCWPRQSFSAKI